MKIFIDDTAMLTSMDVRAKARKLKIEHNVQFLVIDYLQLIAFSKHMKIDTKKCPKFRDRLKH